MILLVILCVLFPPAIPFAIAWFLLDLWQDMRPRNDDW